jgi:hypothetical protein
MEAWGSLDEVVVEGCICGKVLTGFICGAGLYGIIAICVCAGPVICMYV